MDTPKGVTGNCDGRGSYHLVPWTPEWLRQRLHTDSDERLSSLLRVYAHPSWTINTLLINKLRTTPGDQVPEMITQLRNNIAKGLRRTHARELTVMTTVYQDKGHPQPQLDTSDAPKYDTVPALIDSGCTGTAMDSKWARHFNVCLYPYLNPIPVFNVDGTPNKSGQITHYAKIWVQMGNHIGRVNAAVSDLGHRPLILGHDWLQRYNPEIDWKAQILKFPRTQQQRPHVLFTNQKESVYVMDIQQYLRTHETKANAIANEEFQKALEGAKKKLLPAHYKDYLKIFSKEGFDMLPDK